MREYIFGLIETIDSARRRLSDSSYSSVFITIFICSFSLRNSSYCSKNNGAAKVCDYITFLYTHLISSAQMTVFDCFKWIFKVTTTGVSHIITRMHRRTVLNRINSFSSFKYYL